MPAILTQHKGASWQANAARVLNPHYPGLRHVNLWKPQFLQLSTGMTIAPSSQGCSKEQVPPHREGCTLKPNDEASTKDSFNPLN